MRPTLRDIELLDQIEALVPVSFSGNVYRIVRDGRDPIACWHPRGRWDDGNLDVLYTSLTKHGAIAEVEYHLKNQPFLPDFIAYRLFRIPVVKIQVLDLTKESLLSDLGVDLNSWARSSYISREDEYIRTQEIAAVAEFHEHTGLIVPSARSEADNLVILSTRAVVNHVGEPEDLGLVDFPNL